MYFLIELGRELLRAVFLKPPGSRGANNAEQPGTRIPAPEGIEVSKRSQACFLRHIFRIVAASDEPAREVMRRIEMRKDDLVKTATVCTCRVFVVHAVECALAGPWPQWIGPP